MALQSNILLEAEKLLKNNIIITGGHFRIFFYEGYIKESINSGTVMSFSYAADLFNSAREKGLNADLGILINDMGSSCDEKSCDSSSVFFSRKNYKLPSELLNVLKIKGLFKYPYKVFWEKNSRNRGKKELFKLLHLKNKEKIKDKIFKIEHLGYFIEDIEHFGRIILTRTEGHDKYGTPACPLIMTGLNILQANNYERSINFYYIGEDNINNIPNYHAIEKGKIVTQLFGSKIQIENLYFNSF